MRWILICPLTFVMIFAGISDIKSYKIPNFCSIIVLVLGVWGTTFHHAHRMEHVMGGLIISALLLILYLITKGSGIGGGDIKLMSASGILLGIDDALRAFLIAGVLALCVNIPRQLIIKQKKILAFGPYLAMGIWLMAVIHYI